MTKEPTQEELQEKSHLYCLSIAETIKEIATQHPLQFKVILALAGADVCSKVFDAYDEFIKSDGKIPIMYFDMVQRTLDRQALRTQMDCNDKIADNSSIEPFKGLIVNAGKND